MSQPLEPLRAALRYANTRAELADAFRQLFHQMRIVPAEQRAAPAVPLAVRLFNTGHARYAVLAPAETRNPAGPPPAEAGALLGVLMARTAEVVGLLSNPPAPAPPPETAALPEPPKPTTAPPVETPAGKRRKKKSKKKRKPSTAVRRAA